MTERYEVDAQAVACENNSNERARNHLWPAVKVKALVLGPVYIQR